MAGSYAPPGETSYDLWIEKSNLIGVILSGVAYGILFVISVQTILLFLKSSKIAWHLIAYIGFMFTLASLGFGANVTFIQMAYIDDRNIRGGPNAFILQFSSHPMNVLRFSCYIINGWIADALVLSRFIIIWKYMYWLSVTPIIMYMGTVATSIAFLMAMTYNGVGVWAEDTMKLSIAYGSLSISLNIILTLSIAGRLLLASNRVKMHLDPHHAKPYTSLAALLIESSALLSVTSLIWVVSYSRKSPFQNLVLPVLGQIQGIAAVLILLRVAEGRAWCHRTIVTTNGNTSDISG